MRAGLGPVPPLLAGLCDDAAMFPPGDAPAAEAVLAHHRYRAAWYADLVGPLLVGAGNVGEVADAARDSATSDPLPVVLVVPGGPDGLEPAVRAVADQPALVLAGVELASGASGSAAEGARQAVAALDAHLPAGTAGVVEIRRGRGIADALDALGATPYRAKLRTGGTAAAAFPDETELAGFLVGCAARRRPFKCTAGLHHAVRHADPETGFEHHGFLNILVATYTAGEGAGAKVVAEVLRERSGEVLASAIREMTHHQVGQARKAFTSYGTCSIAEPLHDLAELGLLVPATTG